MDRSEMQDRMAELMLPIEKQILMCDNRQDMLMMACAMLQHVNTIFGQFALSFGHDRHRCIHQPAGAIPAGRPLATNPSGPMAGPCHAPL